MTTAFCSIPSDAGLTDPTVDISLSVGLGCPTLRLRWRVWRICFGLNGSWRSV